MLWGRSVLQLSVRSRAPALDSMRDHIGRRGGWSPAAGWPPAGFFLLDRNGQAKKNWEGGRRPLRIQKRIREGLLTMVKWGEELHGRPTRYRSGGQKKNPMGCGPCVFHCHPYTLPSCRPGHTISGSEPLSSSPHPLIFFLSPPGLYLKGSSRGLLTPLYHDEEAFSYPFSYT